MTTSAPLNADFTGGPPNLFEPVGREQLSVLLDHELTTSSVVLDIGCGALRGGRWIIPLLEPGHYCGLEPMKHLVESGLEKHVPREMIELKRPRFDHNDRFDFTVFDERFTHFLARSIWTHASKEQIETMLDGFAATADRSGIMLTSFLPATKSDEDYRGSGWVGRSHESDVPGIVRHSFRWIRDASERRGLAAEIVRRPLVYNGQVWIAVARPQRLANATSPGPGTAMSPKEYRRIERS